MGGGSRQPAPPFPALGDSSRGPRDPDPSASDLTAQAASAWSAVLQWTMPPAVDTVMILRGGLLIDQFPSASGSSYTDRLLWPSTTYTYEVQGLDATGAVVSDQKVDLATPPQTEPFPVPYAPDSFVNTPIGPDPTLDPNSAAMVSKAILPYAGGANLNISDTWAYPIAYADNPSVRYTVQCLLYGCSAELDPFPIPRGAVPNTGSDGHLVIIDPNTNTELDMWQADYAASSDSWSAGSRYVTSTTGIGAMCAAGQRCGGAVAAGFAELAGVLRPEEIAQGYIDHALVFTTPYTRSGFIACPATHTDGAYDDPAAIPEGARIQLDPSFDVDAQPWPAWEKTIARTLQTYGAYLVDTGGSLSIRGEANLVRGYDAWDLAGVTSAGLSSLPWSRMRVLQLQQC